MPKLPTAKKPEEEKAKAETKPTEKSPDTKETKPRGKAKPKEEPRPVLYDKISVNIAMGEKAITEAKALKILGWEEETAEAPFGAVFSIRIEEEQADGSHKDKKVRLLNNVRNRWITPSIYQTLKQQHLRGRWEFNGEPIIIGLTGILLNGQHSLIALVLAVREWRKHPDKYPFWKTEPTMDKLVVFGVSEADNVVNTMDTAKPRTLAEVIGRSQYFANVAAKDRRQLSKNTESAIKMLWHRTGAAGGAFGIKRTHAESLDFIRRHERLLKAVKHIYEENGTSGRIGQYLAAGYASAMLYLMATSESERETKEENGYTQVPEPNENLLDFSNWDNAVDFWTQIAAGDKKVGALREALGLAIERGGASVAERTALIVKGWVSWLDNKGEIQEEDLALEYVSDPDTGAKTIAECPTVGGIDLGNPKD